MDYVKAFFGGGCGCLLFLILSATILAAGGGHFFADGGATILLFLAGGVMGVFFRWVYNWSQRKPTVILPPAPELETNNAEKARLVAGGVRWVMPVWMYFVIGGALLIFGGCIAATELAKR